MAVEVDWNREVRVDLAAGRAGTDVCFLFCPGLIDDFGEIAMRCESSSCVVGPVKHQAGIQISGIQVQKYHA